MRNRKKQLIIGGIVAAVVIVIVMLIILLTQSNRPNFPTYNLRSGMTQDEAIQALEKQGFKRVMEDETYEILFASKDVLGFTPTLEELVFPGRDEFGLCFYFYGSGTTDLFPEKQVRDMPGTYKKLKEALIREFGTPEVEGDYLRWQKDAGFSYELDYSNTDFFSFNIIVN